MKKALLVFGLAMAAPGFWQALPDLIVERVDASQVLTDSQTLATSGQVSVRVKNIGGGLASGSVRILAFEDRNLNDMYDQAADLLLGQATVSLSLVAGAQGNYSIPVSGNLLFKGNRIHVLADADNSIAEQSEVNNVGHSAQSASSVPSPQPLAPYLKWKRNSYSVNPTSTQIWAAPAVIDLNGDGVADLVYSTFVNLTTWYESTLRAVDGRNGAELWTVSSPSLLVKGSEIAAADIDGDGRPEIIAVESFPSYFEAYHLLCFNHDGTFRWRSPRLNNVNAGAPVIADLDGDGSPEIIIGSSVVSATGSLKWRGALGNAFQTWAAASIVADITLDGKQEVIAGNTVYRHDGSVLWNVPLGDGYNAVGNFDLDPFPEIVLVTNGSVYLLEHTGQVKRGPILIPGGGLGGPPVIGDMDGDGTPEIVVAGLNSLAVLDSTGSLRWSKPIQDTTSSSSSSALFDFDGDGKVEILHRDELNLRILRGADGFILFETPMPSATGIEGPVVADLEGDGFPEIIVTSDVYFGSSPGAGVYVFTSNNRMPTRSIWNQHAYSITNINDDGSIPRYPQPNWLTPGLNNFRLNTFPEPQRALGAPDFVPSFIRTDSTTFPLSARLTARIGNGGSASGTTLIGGMALVPVSFYRGDPATGGTLLGTTQTTKALAPGEFEDVSITWNNPPAGTHPIVVVVDPENLIAEGDETNNKAGMTITLGAGPATLVDSVISRFKDQSADVIWARVPDAASYRVYRRTQGGVPQQVRAGLTGTSFTDTGLTNGTTYLYTVRWVNARGVESPDGTEASVTPTPLGSAGNTPPTILSYPATRGRTGNPYSYQLRAADPDAGEVLTYSLVTPPAGMTISPTGLIAWAPAPAQAGAHRINVRVTDRTNRFATQSFTLYVDTVLVNNPPTFISQPISSAQTGVQYAYQARAIDPDAGDLLTYSLTTEPAGMTINGAGLITWTPLIAQVGVHPVSVRVRDLLGLEAVQNFNITVTRLNRPPQILSQAPATGRVGTLYTYQVAATDPDLGAGDTLTFSLAGQPAGMTISTTGLIQWTPAQQGTLGATVRVTDSAGLTASQTFTVNVLPANQPPVITSVAPLNASVGGLYTYAAVATDPDGDALTWSVVQGPTGLTIHPTTGVVAWTPTTSQQSAHPVTIRVQDSLGAGVNQSFTITVGPADNTNPTVTILTPASGTSLNADVTVTGTVTDDNLQEWKLSYRVPGEANWIPIASGTTNVAGAALGSFRASLLANNPYRILLEARDAAGNSDSQEIEVLVDAGDLKLGDFSITFTDMTIPGLGLPVAIQRTYDTKQPQTGDFGPHWSLSFSGVYLRRDVNFNVFATLPSGRRVKFNYTPQGIGLGVFNTRWTAESGTYDTLENTDCPQVLGPPPTPLCGGFQPWDPQNWILRTKEGFTYFITSGGGIRRMEDRNGNWMEITSTGVTTNTGQNIPFVRDAQGRIIEIGEPAPSPGKYRYEYDAEGRLSAFLDPTGAATRYRYQNGSFPNYLTAIDDPLGRPVMRNLYDEAGRLIAQCDANGNPATLAGCVRFDPNISTRTQTIYTARGFRTDLILDTRGNILNERRYTNSTQFLETVRTYDPSNNLLTERDPAGNLKTFTYSVRGNRLTETDPGGRTTTYTYNACDKVATETDPAGQTTTYTYDSACRLTEVRNALNHITRYAYNSNGQRTGFTDANGNTWTWAYNAQGFLTSLTDPFGKPSSFTFNSTGDLLSRTDRLGRRIDFQYDSAHRMTRETWNTGRVTTYAYDTAGQLIVAMDPDSTLSMSYDANGRLRTVDNQGTPGVPRVVMTYGYDANGNVTQVADSLGGVTDYAYDGLDRLARVTQSGTGVQPKRVDMEYDGASLLRAMRRFSNLTGTAAVANTLYEYECGGCPARLSAIRHRRASDNGVIHDLTYTRDAVGNITQMIDADGTHNYTYDAIRRLLTATHSNTALQPNEFYNLDPMGNRITSHLSNTHLYQRNRLIEDQQHTYLYDDEGNQIRKTVKATGAYTEYVYDHRNRVTTVIERTSSGTETARHTYAFDVINRRIRANEAGTQAAWAYDGLNPALKMTPTGTMISRRIYSRNLDQVVADQDAAQTRWFLVDQVGSTRDLVSNLGVALNRFIYDSYGRGLTSSSGQPGDDLAFSAREIIPGTQLMYLRARIYDPQTGRFLSSDAVLPRSYSYGASSPLRYRDNLGLLAILDYVTTLRNFVQPQIKPLLNIGANIAGLLGGTAGGISFQGLKLESSSIKQLRSNFRDLVGVLVTEDPGFAMFYYWLQSLEPIGGTDVRDNVELVFFDVLSYYLDEIK